MKKIFLNFGLFLALGLTIAVFNSCDEDDDKNGGSGSISKITATNVINGSTQIKTVKALVYWGDYDNEDAIAQAPYTNNGFTLELPKTLSAKYLFLISEDAPSGITISDKNVKIYVLEDISGYDKDDDEIGYFYLEEEKGDNEYYTSWIYSDRDVTIKGQDDGDKYNLQLKKGWNVVYDSYTDNGFSLMSEKPSGVNYSWNFYGAYGYRSASVPVGAKSAYKADKFWSRFRTIEEK